MKSIKMSSLSFVICGIVLFLFGFFLRGFIPVPNVSPTSSPTPVVQKNIILPELKDGEHIVSRVVDGDSIYISIGEKVRYFGVNTPEINVRWGSEAKKYNEKMVLGKKVRIELGNPKLDKYGRILAYVWVVSQDNLGKEVMVNKLLLEEGFSKLYLVKGDAKLKYLDVLTQAEAWGKDHHNGLWFDEWTGKTTKPSTGN